MIITVKNSSIAAIMDKATSQHALMSLEITKLEVIDYNKTTAYSGIEFVENIPGRNLFCMPPKRI